jgi:hypothetical protein
MSTTARADIQEEIDVFETDFQSRRNTGAIPSDEEIAKRWADLENRYG